MVDKGKDPLPIFKKSILKVKKINILRYFGLALGKRITLFKQKN